MEPNNSTITTVDALKATYPDLVTTIENNAAAAERARIKGIKDMALDGFENIVEDAMFENPISAEAAAVKIINEQKKQGGAYLANREEDVSNSKANEVGGSASEKGANNENPYDKIIDAVLGNKEV